MASLNNMHSSDMYHHSEFEDAQNQKSAKYTEGSLLEKACSQERIEKMSEAEVSSLSSFSLEMPPGDSLFDYERSNPASDVSQEDTGERLKDNTVSQENQHFIEENFVEEIATHDSDFDYSLTEESAAKINEASEIDSEPGSWDGKKSLYSKRSLSEKDFKEPLTMEGLHLQDTLHEMPKEDGVKHKNSVVENTLFETIANKISKENEFSVRNNTQPAPEEKISMQTNVDTVAGTQKSLLDCIVRACSKEVALFLTQPAETLVRSLMKRHSCPDRIDFGLNKDILNESGKMPNDIETKLSKVGTETEMPAHSPSMELSALEQCVKKSSLADMQKHLDVKLAKKQQFDHKYNRVVNDVKTLQEEFEKKQDETQNLELCMEMIKKENLELQQQILRMGNLFHLKSDECITLSEENVKLRRNLNKLLCKVKSYEEIIQCADRRLEVLSSQVSQLEKRNQYLELLNKKTKGKSINNGIVTSDAG